MDEQAEVKRIYSETGLRENTEWFIHGMSTYFSTSLYTFRPEKSVTASLRLVYVNSSALIGFGLKKRAKRAKTLVILSGGWAKLRPLWMKVSKIWWAVVV